MKRVLVPPVAGALVGGGVYWAFTAHWYLVLVIGIVYTAAVYFWLTAGSDLLGPAFSFDDRTDAVGHGIGLFGLTVSPVAFGQYYTDADVDPVFLIWFIGVIAFLQFAGVVAHRNDRDRERRT